MLRVLIRTVSMRRFYSSHNIYLILWIRKQSQFYAEKNAKFMDILPYCITTCTRLEDTSPMLVLDNEKY